MSSSENYIYGIPAITTFTCSLTGVTTCCTITTEGELPRAFKLDKVRGLEEGQLIRIIPISTNWARLTEVTSAGRV